MSYGVAGTNGLDGAAGADSTVPGPQGPTGLQGDPSTDTLGALGPFCTGSNDIAVWDGLMWDCSTTTDVVCNSLGANPSCDLKMVIADIVNPPKTVFVTSNTYNPNLGGIAGGDSICQSLADTAGLDGTYMAWLSDDTLESPATRFTQSEFRYVRVDGVQIAADWTDLTDGLLDAVINVDETGATQSSTDKVMTGTEGDGTADTNYAAGASNCAGWTNGTGGFSPGTPGGGWRGNNLAFNNPQVLNEWTTLGAGGCATADHFFCFAQ